VTSAHPVSMAVPAQNSKSVEKNRDLCVGTIPSWA
jgi:hypothetical protein